MEALVNAINLTGDPGQIRAIVVNFNDGSKYRIAPKIRTLTNNGEGYHFAQLEGRTKATPGHVAALRLVCHGFLDWLEEGDPESLAYSQLSALDSLAELIDWTGWPEEGEDGERLAVLCDCAAHFQDFA